MQLKNNILGETPPQTMRVWLCSELTKTTFELLFKSNHRTPIISEVILMGAIHDPLYFSRKPAALLSANNEEAFHFQYDNTSQ